MNFPDDRMYSEHHLWIKLERGQALIGITDHAREELGEIDYVELPEPDSALTKNKPFGIVETSKAVVDLISPLTGLVVKNNDILIESPETVTDDPYGDGWLVILETSDPDEFDDLFSAATYREILEGGDPE
jgi:glycine cleavage system H protein